MKVKELIDKLQELDPEEDIVIGNADVEYGYSSNDIDIIKEGKDWWSEDKVYYICDEDFAENSGLFNI